VGQTRWRNVKDLSIDIEYVDSTTGWCATYSQAIRPKQLSGVTIPALPPKAFLEINQDKGRPPIASLVTNEREISVRHL
jgi:hypothetical protein